MRFPVGDRRAELSFTSQRSGAVRPVWRPTLFSSAAVARSASMSVVAPSSTSWHQTFVSFEINMRSVALCTRARQAEDNPRSAIEDGIPW